MASHDVNLEVFVSKQLDIIETQASGRSKEHKELRDGCQGLKNMLRGAEFGKPGSRLSIPFSADVTDALLTVIRTALSLNTPKLSEPALACLHKLVAYAYLQGETRPSGRLDDADNVVTRAVIMTARCGDSTSTTVQLGVVRALLTLTTADHFAAHGDCLMLAVRTVFNIAMGGANSDIQNTARSALLQMVNTILKRVAQQIITPEGTPLPSPLMYHRHASTDAERASSVASIDELSRASLHAEHAAQISGALETAASVAHSRPTGLPRIKTPPNVMTPESISPRQSNAAANAAAVAIAAAAQQQHLEDARTARLATLAEQADLVGLERALDAIPSQDPSTLTPPASVNELDEDPLTPSGSAFRAASKGGKDGGGAAAAAGGGSGSRIMSSSRSPLRRAETPPDPRRALMKERRMAEWKRLTIPERDAVTVISAMCKMAARETGPGASVSYLHTGKLLALDILVRVLTNPAHDWGQVRRHFAEQLRQPLCLALLRNCASPYDAAVSASVRILSAILAAQRLREGLKAEVGALYPLLLLRPLEAERPDSPHQALAALEGLTAVCSSPQVLVDVFINYDCSLQAANLFERSIKALAKYVQVPASGVPGLPPAEASKARAAALKALLAAIKSMDTWAGPLKSGSMGMDRKESSATESEGAGAGAGGGSGSGGVTADSAGAQQQPFQHDVLERIHLDKARKSSLAAGIAAFNRNPIKGMRALVSSGAVGASASEGAAFLKQHKDALDAEAVGELLGHHDEENIAIMHSFIDSENFYGLSLDIALRRLLAGFRLPGEAQKIDRIMEKFAERFCSDNPAAFPSADAAYLLAFALIMLNTDAHNPMADARLSLEDFVSMCNYQAESGEYLQILPTEYLEGMYKAILKEEIKVPGGVSGSGSSEAEKKRGNKEQGRLAAAVGLGQLAAPFWAGNAWDKQHGVDVERRRLLEVTAALLEGTPGGGGAGGSAMWHAATHAEHARPMMQVCGVALARALSAALASSSSLAEATPVLVGYEHAICLAALLWLEQLCETLVSGLAAAASVSNPAPPHTLEEARQVAALSRLVSLGSASEAGALGSSWIFLLRTISELEALKAALTPGSQSGGSLAAAAASVPGASGAGGGDSASGAAAAGGEFDPSSSGISRLFTRMGLKTGPGSASLSTTVVSERSGRRGPLAVREAPGMGAVIWAETAGAAPIDKIFQNSAALDGDTVLTFIRALCAASQEELDPGMPGVPPKVHLLHRVVECAYLNTNRIRLVWQRLWTVVSQHLVSAACHPDAYVAMYAVDALRQLADKLLRRAELAGFTSQGDALRPLTAVLRCSDSASVRELAAACVAHAVDAHAARIGSGWRAVAEALAVAASDPSPAVVTQALDGMSVVFAALYEPEGHACLPECVGGAMAAMSNPAPAVADLTSTALYLFQTLARRLSEASNAAPQHLGLDSVQDSSHIKTAVTRRGSLSAAVPVAPTQMENPGALRDAWLTILGPLAAVARCDPRPRMADTAVVVLFQILHASSAGFSKELWGEIFESVLAPLLTLPKHTHHDGGDNNGSAFTSPDETPRTAPLRRRPTFAAGAPLSLPMPTVGQFSGEGSARVLRHAASHLPDLWSLLGSQQLGETGGAVAASALLAPSLKLLQSYAESEDDGAAALGTEQLHGLLAEAGPGLGSEGWNAVESALRGMVAVPTVYTTTPSGQDGEQGGGVSGAALRRRCRASLLAMRCVAELLQNSAAAMPCAVQLNLLGAIEDAVAKAASVNASQMRRSALADALKTSSTSSANQQSTSSLLEGGSHSTNGNHAAADSAVASGTAGSVPVSPYSPSSPVSIDTLALATAVKESALEWDKPLLPALARHEVEGGRLLLASLQRGAMHPAAADASGVAALKTECERRLVEYALSVVRSAAGRISGPDGAAAPAAGGRVSGEEALRAPVVADALLALCAVPADAWKSPRGEVFGLAARLVCSSELTVRKAVQQLLRAQASGALKQVTPTAATAADPIGQ